MIFFLDLLIEQSHEVWSTVLVTHQPLRKVNTAWQVSQFLIPTGDLCQKGC